MSLSGTKVLASVESLMSLRTSERLSQTSVRSNLPPRSRFPAFTPLTIIPAISLIRLLGKSFTIVFMSSIHPLASPSLSLLSPPMKINLSRLAPNGKRVSDSRLLAATSLRRLALNASYVAAYSESSMCVPNTAFSLK